ncbi:unnamed protein product [Cyprideis torosa]|uniref:Uncharacterized protein n=1 Tax=Cyprideis torosa TaxID=163714 RepID=A0A7R8ZLH2_9CRUS|nr:unnamed protein product [Cyprideis torosa]CAG0893164.1 unnamed protein product [Cyprideis torosa]
MTTTSAPLTTTSAPAAVPTPLPGFSTLWEEPSVVQTATAPLYSLAFANVPISLQEGDVIYAGYEVTSMPPSDLVAEMKILSGGSLDSSFGFVYGMVFDPPFFRTYWLYNTPTNFYVKATCQATGRILHCSVNSRLSQEGKQAIWASNSACMFLSKPGAQHSSERFSFTPPLLLRRLRSVYFLGLLNDSRNCPICPWINADLPHWTGTLKESFIQSGKPVPFFVLSNLVLHRFDRNSLMMAELKLADDIQDPRLEEPVNDILSKENISTFGGTLRSVYFLGLLNDSRNCPICPSINANLPHWTGTLKESFIQSGKTELFVALSNLLLHRNC